MTKLEDRFAQGRALQQQGNLTDAERLYEKVLRQRPGHFDSLYQLGVIALRTGRMQRSVDLIAKAIRLNPHIADAHCNLGTGLAILNRLEEAVASYTKAITLKPDHLEAICNRGNALRDLRRTGEAIANYDQAIALKPDLAEAHHNRGIALRDLNRHDEAIESYATTIRLKPAFAEAYYDQALCLLHTGNYERGWRQFEWRKKRARPVAARTYPRPLWLGEQDIAGKTVFLHWEQGLGDTIQFCRYARLVEAQGGRVIMEVEPPLQRLLGQLSPNMKIISPGEKPPAFDFHCPIMSLPLAFRTTLETIPSEVPYLHADPGLGAAWRERLARLPGRKIGLVWAGSAHPDNPLANKLDKRRSTTLEHYAPLALPGLSWISLQKGEPAAQARTPPAGMLLHDWTDELKDFAGTAALVRELDLVITVCTSVAHLAGALGKPVWVLCHYDHCWRWLRDRTDSPWYPSARVFRQQTPGDWHGMIQDVAAALRAG